MTTGDLRLSVGELFAGVGGFSLGLDAAGWRTRWHVERDEDCRAVLARHWPEARLLGDIRSASGGDLEPVDAIVFGSPCQDLSRAGLRAGLEGERSGLFAEAIRVIEEMRDATGGTRPRAVVWENVAGALSSSGGRDLVAALGALVGLGALVVEWAVVDAIFFGVPQRRRRLLAVALLDPRARSSEPLLPLAASRPGDPPADGSLVGFYSNHGQYGGAVVDGVPPLVLCAGISLPTACCVVGMDRPPRRLTPRESERAMGWPDDHTRWRADGSEIPEAARYRMCGNGIVAPVAEWAGRHLAAALEAAA